MWYIIASILFALCMPFFLGLVIWGVAEFVDAHG